MRPRFALQVVYRSGEIAYLRHGGVTGEGVIVTFRNRLTAEVNRDFISEGLDEGAIVTVVRYQASMES